MAERDEFELTIIESMEAYPPPSAREGIAAADLIVTPEEALEALSVTKGAAPVLERLPLPSGLTCGFRRHTSASVEKREPPGISIFGCRSLRWLYRHGTLCHGLSRVVLGRRVHRMGFGGNHVGSCEIATSLHRPRATTRAMLGCRAGRPTRGRWSSALSTGSRSPVAGARYDRSAAPIAAGGGGTPFPDPAGVGVVLLPQSDGVGDSRGVPVSPRSVSPTVASRPQGGGSATVDRSRATHAKEHLGPLWSLTHD